MHQNIYEYSKEYVFEIALNIVNVLQVIHYVRKLKITHDKD